MSSELELPKNLNILCRVMQAVAAMSAAALIIYGLLDDGIGQIVDVFWDRLDSNIRDVTVYSGPKQAVVTLIAGLSLYSPLVIFFGIWRVFERFARGPILSSQSVSTVRLLGWLIIVWAVMNILSYPAMFFAMTYGNPEGMRVLSIALGTEQLQKILFGVLLVVLGHVLTRAVALAEENRQFI